MSDTYHIPHDALREAMEALFAAAGSPPEEAAQVSKQLLGANLTGHDSHGVIRASYYVRFVREGIIQTGQQNRVLKDTGSTVLLSAGWGFGQTAATAAMKLAIERARQYKVAAVGVTEVNHVGRLADYANQASAAGMLALVFTGSASGAPLVAPFGGMRGVMGTSPMAVGFPSDRDTPVVWDMATSALAEGKVKVARDARKPLPPGIIMDQEGHPSTDPEDFYGGGAIRPLGGEQGYKGYLLNFLVMALGGLMTGGGYPGHPARAEGGNNSTMMLVLDVSAFRELPDFKRELNALIDHLKGTPAMPGQEVLAPGEVEQRREAERRAGGVPLAAATVAALQAELDHYGLPHQLAALAQGQAVPA